MKMMMMMKIASMNVHNSLMMNRRDIEISESMFDLLRFENNEIREMIIVQMRFDRFEKFADLMKTEEIEIEHLEIESFENESM
jgi:hypothetical protein